MDVDSFVVLGIRAAAVIVHVQLNVRIAGLALPWVMGQMQEGGGPLKRPALLGKAIYVDRGNSSAKMRPLLFTIDR